MEQIGVNLTLEREVWERLGQIVPSRKRSLVINQLLKAEIERRIRENEEKALGLAFSQAAKDIDRQAAINEWSELDTEAWS